MRIPPSAIVMTLVVSVPFGLAIRDSLKGDDLQSKLDRAQAETARAEAEARAAEARAELAAKQAEAERDSHRAATFAKLLGATRGSMGPAISAEIGQPAPNSFEYRLDSLEDLEFRDGVMPGLQVSGDGKLVSVSLPIGDTHCSEMQKAAEHAWGSAEANIWIDTDHKRRASLYGLLCVLHFDQYVDNTAWVKLALPKILGKTNQQAAKLVGSPTVPLEDDQLSWYAPGALNGRDSTEIVSSRGVDDKIETTNASTTVTAPQASELIEELGKQLGVPGEAQTDTLYVWEKQQISARYNIDSQLLVVTHSKGHE